MTSYLTCSSIILGGSAPSSCAPSLSIENSKLPLKAGHDVTIKCRVCGKKYIFWFKDGKRYGETERVRWEPAKVVSLFPRVVVEGKLKIENLTKKDRGIYACYATNFFTSIMEKADIKLVGK